jgi:hypothetical protein
MLSPTPRPSAQMISRFRKQAVCMGAQTLTSFGTCWTCPCGHTIKDDDVAHALACNRLSSLVQSCHDDTAEVPQEFVGRLGFSSSHEERYCRLAPSIPNRPQERWDFRCNLRPGPGRILADVSFIHPLAASNVHSACRGAGSCMASWPCSCVSRRRQALGLLCQP